MALLEKPQKSLKLYLYLQLLNSFFLLELVSQGPGLYQGGVDLLFFLSRGIAALTEGSLRQELFRGRRLKAGLAAHLNQESSRCWWSLTPPGGFGPGWQVLFIWLFLHNPKTRKVAQHL